ncbi:MAG: 6-pyruvoyl-tetrahydropterin synthase-related protein [Patescibacteria group bacterium]
MLRHLILLVILSLVTLWPFFKKGFFESHDGEWMVIRFTAFHQALTSGQFPVRYVERLNNNYGYPVLNFLYPLPFYLAEIPKVLGLGFVDSIKAVFIASTVISSLAMYWALSRIATYTAAFAGAIIYLFIPYRFVDLYVRGSLGEIVALAVVPVIAGCILKLREKKQIYAPILALAVGLLILSHNVIAVLFLPFFLVMSRIILGKNIIGYVPSFILGIATTTFFWLPALYDLKLVRISQIKVSEITDHLVDFSKLIFPSWGYGPNPNSPDGLSVQIGLVAVFIFLATLTIMIATKTKNKQSFSSNNLISYMLIAFVLITLTNTKLALTFWQNLPGADAIQFPWRMHSILIFITAFLAAFVIDSAKNKTLLVALVAVAAITSTIFYTKPSTFVDRGDNYYATNEDTTNSRDEYLPIWVRLKPKDRPAEKIELVGPGQIVTKSQEHLKYEAVYESPAQTSLKINTVYFPQFVAKVDGRPSQISYDNDLGVISVKLPSGSHKAIISYTSSPVARASEVISLLALFGTGVYFFTLWRKPKIISDS